MKKLLFLALFAITTVGCVKESKPVLKKFEVVHHGNIHDTIIIDCEYAFYANERIFHVNGECSFTNVEYYKRIH